MDLVSPLRQPHSQVLPLSQRTDQFLRKNGSIGALKIPIPIVSSPESTELWTECEKLFLSCLRTGDDKGAFLCLEKLIERFGASNEKIMGLRGLYQEAVAEDEAALRKILREYDDILAEDPTNTPVAKRRIAILRILNRPSDAVDALTELLDSSPTDVEAWAELADLYFRQGLSHQAVFCLEEVLLVIPNAWNIHARLGEILYITGTANGDRSVIVEAMRRFCRSLELCNGYIRGCYGLKLTSDWLLLPTQNSPGQAVESADAGVFPPSPQVLRQLNEKATSQLAEATRRGMEAGSDYAELVAAKLLVDKSTSKMSDEMNH